METVTSSKKPANKMLRTTAAKKKKDYETMTSMPGQDLMLPGFLSSKKKPKLVLPPSDCFDAVPSACSSFKPLCPILKREGYDNCRKTCQMCREDKPEPKSECKQTVLVDPGCEKAKNVSVFYQRTYIFSKQKW